MEIRSLWTPSGHRDLPRSRIRSNTLHLLTGANGSGKTESLAAIMRQFTRNTGDYYYSPNASQLSDRPSRTISQTFSPFSRFPRPLADSTSLADIYGDDAEDRFAYYCIGLHSQTRFVGKGLTKQIIEQAIYRLSERSKSVHAIFEVMRGLDLRDSLLLTYVPKKDFRFLTGMTGDQRTRIRRYLEEAAAGYWPSHHIFKAQLRRQLNQTNLDDLAELVSTAFEVVAPYLERGKFRLDLNGTDQKSLDFALLQALSLLRRLNLLELASCEISTIGEHRFDVAMASSGQQQMLCSIIGLAATLKDSTLVVIDEPELSLHPRWQQSYLEHLLMALSPHRDCHVLIATHSPLIVQSAQHRGVEVLHMSEDVDENTPSPRRPSVEGALLDVFNTPVAGSAHLANLILSTVTAGTTGDYDTNLLAIAELERLRRLYSHSHRDDHAGKDLELIERGLELLTLSESGDE